MAESRVRRRAAEPPARVAGLPIIAGVDAALSLARALDEALPQTQCTRCGYADCRGYAEAMVGGLADIDRCPPGGAEGVARLAELTGRPLRPLNAVNGIEGPRQVAVIDEPACIGCTLCLQVCPVDCILGGPKSMHTVIASLCTGCELCLPVCPVDCIALHPVSGSRTGWQAWSAEQAVLSKDRYRARLDRLARNARDETERLDAIGPAPRTVAAPPA